MLQKQLCLLFLITSFILLCCTSRSVQPAFYYWNDQWELSRPSLHYLDTLGNEQIYLRFFDVEWDAKRNRALPIRTVNLSGNIPIGLEIVPVVYLSENVLEEINGEQVNQLAGLIHERILRICDTLPLKTVQIDCNWRPETQKVYFEFLNHLGNKLGLRGPALNCAIYPHHITGKDSLGVPPVDRGMFMLFDIDDLAMISAQNTICSEELLRPAVLATSEYPLSLDISLPIFNWGLVVRNQEPIALMRHLHLSQLEDRERFEVVNAYFYKVLADTYLDGVFLYANDLIRVEALSPDELKATLKPLAPYLRRDTLQVGFYHFDLNVLNEYPVPEIEDLLELFD